MTYGDAKRILNGAPGNFYSSNVIENYVRCLWQTTLKVRLSVVVISSALVLLTEVWLQSVRSAKEAC